MPRQKSISPVGLHEGAQLDLNITLTMEDTTPKQATPPYLAYKTFNNFVVGLRKGPLPSRIDRTLMNGYSGGVQSAMMQTLKFLGLIQEGGAPTAALTQLGEQQGDELKFPADLVKKAYAFVFASGVNLETATDGQLQEVFRASGVSGETIRKAMAFFVAVAEPAGIKISPHVKSAKNKISSGGTSPARGRKRKVSNNEDEEDDDGLPEGHQEGDGIKTHTLPLNVEGNRVITVTAPLDLQPKEITRIKKWLEITLLIEGEAE